MQAGGMAGERTPADGHGVPVPAAMSDVEFGQFRRLLFDRTGISLSPAKKTMVCGRLARRLIHHAVTSYAEYYRLLMLDASGAELQAAVDLLTTNETYFFREPAHFAFLEERIKAAASRPGRLFRVWSAACSSGEEPYSIAMVLDDRRGAAPWEVVGSDVSTRVLARARRGHYVLDRIDGLPKRYLERYCLKGIGSQAGTLLIDRTLRNRVRFMQINLMEALPDVGQFDVIFLRNVMIYFDADVKRRVVERLLPCLKADGDFIIGHAESLAGVTDKLVAVAPAIYRRA